MNAPVTPPLPPFIHPDDMPARYALLGVGSCMEPIIKDGELPTFDKTLKPQPGDIVGIIFTAERARHCGMPGLVKRLVLSVPPILGASSKGNAMPVVLVEQINPQRTMAIPVEHILAVHKFIGIAQPAGPGRASIALAGGEA